MSGNSQQRDGLTTGRDRVCDGDLTPESRNTLANLAVVSEAHTELGDAMKRAGRALASLVEQPSEFSKPSSELREKMTQLHNAHKELGRQVMSFSHAYEDAAASKTVSH